MKENLGSIHDMSLLDNSPILSFTDDYGAASSSSFVSYISASFITHLYNAFVCYS